MRYTKLEVGDVFICDDTPVEVSIVSRYKDPGSNYYRVDYTYGDSKNPRKADEKSLIISLRSGGWRLKEEREEDYDIH